MLVQHRNLEFFFKVKYSDLNLIFLQDTDEKFWVIGRTQDEAMKRAVARFNVSEDKITLTQGGDN